MKRGKSARDDGKTVDLLKEGGDIVLQKLANLFSNCIRTSKVPIAWKNANKILIHRNDDTKRVTHQPTLSCIQAVYQGKS